MISLFIISNDQICYLNFSTKIFWQYDMYIVPGAVYPYGNLESGYVLHRTRIRTLRLSQINEELSILIQNRTEIFLALLA